VGVVVKEAAAAAPANTAQATSTAGTTASAEDSADSHKALLRELRAGASVSPGSLVDRHHSAWSAQARS